MKVWIITVTADFNISVEDADNEQDAIESLRQRVGALGGVTPKKSKKK